MSTYNGTVALPCRHVELTITSRVSSSWKLLTLKLLSFTPTLWGSETVVLMLPGWLCLVVPVPWGSGEQRSPGIYNKLFLSLPRSLLLSCSLSFSVCPCACMSALMYACMVHNTSNGKPYLNFPHFRNTPQHILQNQRDVNLPLPAL